jgi:speckle-type POZ protein
MFQHNMQESKTGEVMIQEIEKDIFYQFLHFIYSGETSDPLTETTAQQLLAAAVKYNIQDLKDECASFLLPYVSETTAQKMFELADAFHVKNLKEECENILLLDIQMNNVLNLIIWADLHSAEDVKEAALNFARANSETLFQSDDYEKMMREYPDICLEATRHMTCSSVLQLRLKRLKSLLMQSDSD